MKKLWENFFYSFPVQLLLLHIKKNTWLFVIWGILFGFLFENGIGDLFGVPYLFLDPEYNHSVDFKSLVILGVAVGGFIIAYHITCYIIDGHRFPFLGNVSQPFTKFIYNNNTLPWAFVITYLVNFIRFQLNNSFIDEKVSVWKNLTYDILGFIVGLLIAIVPMALYFVSTNQDVFKMVAKGVNRRLINPKIRRVNVMKDFAQARTNRIRVDTYLDFLFRSHKADSVLTDLATALKVLRQNHLNAFIIQVFVFAQIVFLGVFRDNPLVQIPAAASIILFFTLALLFSGAVALWLHRWANPALIAAFLLLNWVWQKDWFEADYKAFGLDYTKKEYADYSFERLQKLSSDSLYRKDKDSTLTILERWKVKSTTTGKKPTMILICTSGGGERAAVWTMRCLQYADSVLQGNLMRKTTLITGASGGLIGAAYFRELYLQRLKDTTVQLYTERWLDNLGKDNLNSVALTLVVSDLLFKTKRFEYNGFNYYKDRGYAFEQSLGRNTEWVLDKKLKDYYLPERQALIPMLFVSPTVVNDGRKLYISPQYVSYMTAPDSITKRNLTRSVKGIEFRRFFEAQQADSLRFLSALRMSATFPYITPNVTLPSNPEMEIMDAGISDNFGIHDAIRFLYVFKDWIAANTSGVILLSIRDTPKDFVIEAQPKQSLFQKIFTPIGSLYTNWHTLQDFNNDNEVEYARSWFKGKLSRVNLQYTPQLLESRQDSLQTDSLRLKYLQKRASLSWRLTEREKQSLRETIFEQRNQLAIETLRFLLK